MEPEKIAPEILANSWGRLEIAGQPEPFKDAKLYPGGARPWDWNETGIRHSPGIQPADLEELLEHGVQVVVLSRGRLERLEVSPETQRYLQAKGVELEIYSTDEAIQRYNELRRGARPTL